MLVSNDLCTRSTLALAIADAISLVVPLRKGVTLLNWLDSWVLPRKELFVRRKLNWKWIESHLIDFESLCSVLHVCWKALDSFDAIAKGGHQSDANERGDQDRWWPNSYRLTVIRWILFFRRDTFMEKLHLALERPVSKMRLLASSDCQKYRMGLEADGFIEGTFHGAIFLPSALISYGFQL